MISVNFVFSGINEERNHEASHAKQTRKLSFKWRVSPARKSSGTRPAPSYPPARGPACRGEVNFASFYISSSTSLEKKNFFFTKYFFQKKEFFLLNRKRAPPKKFHSPPDGPQNLLSPDEAIEENRGIRGTSMLRYAVDTATTQRGAAEDEVL
jgi:hypothetical protein